MKKTLPILIALAGIALFPEPRVQASTVTFYNDPAAFAAAIGATASTIDFSSLVCSTCYKDYGYSSHSPADTAVTLDNVTFEAVTGSINLGLPLGLTIVGQNAPYAASSFYSAFLGEGNGGAIEATLPGGVTAIGAYVGDVYNYSTTVEPGNLNLTLTGGSGLLDTRTVALDGLAKGSTPAPLEFVGYIVSGDVIDSLTFNPGTYFGLTGFEYVGTSTPEPATGLLLIGGLAAARFTQKRKTAAR